MTKITNQKEFLAQLQQELKHLSSAECDDILNDYRSHFAEGLANGRSEADIIAGLGDPSVIAKELLANQYIEQWQKKKSFKNLWYVLSVNASLGLVNIGVSLPVLMGMLITTLLSIGFGILAVLGTVFALASLSQQLFGFPQLNAYHLNTSGIGPVLIDTTPIGPLPPHIDIKGKDNQEFKLERGSDGSVTIYTQKDGETFTIEKKADGSIGKIYGQNNQGESIHISDIRKPGFWSQLCIGLFTAAIGLFGFWLTRRTMNRLLSFWKKHLQWTQTTRKQFMP
ncbi:DUF1700 domain-containing protein [Pasteurellaceae bacterium USgator11]|nr:DUF1700 domain-containing protein [Pasteurellaceae bacterium USgator41]TNG97117.1 DUF1700 domain-containing protein [Pasteurellaceae bacterium UScroc12]TNG98153.1 DUF1700 domain-containing protein [Pasteurellaceae bacterium UScroc31]TNH00412.1 DUF1700 domain-containing protein [Pasteurellaceae bacterium USgator11]